MTMKTPEMEVVRFNESDVIVASGDPTQFMTATISNAGGAKRDLTVTLAAPGQNAVPHSFEDLLADSNTAYAANPTFFNKDNAQATLHNLIDDDNDNGSGKYSAWNGSYYSENGGSIYYWRQ